MSNIAKTQKRKHTHQQPIHGTGKHKNAVRDTSFVSMSEARQIAELVFSGIAWSG